MTYCSFRLIKVLLALVCSCSILSTSIMNVAALESISYEGSYRIVALLDGTNMALALPADRDFTLQVVKNKVNYSFRAKIGNSIFGQINIVENYETSTAISIEGGGSTRMMPPPEINVVEVAFNSIMQTASTIRYDDIETKEILVIEGKSGTIKCSRVDD
jgi:hypothetical protein